MNVSAPPAGSITLRPVSPDSVPEFDGLLDTNIGTIEYASLATGDAFQRSVSLAGLFAVDGTRDVLEAVRALNADIKSDSAAGDGPITAAVLQASDGSLYGTRALASTNLAPIGPMPLDERGFHMMPYNTGYAYDASHVIVDVADPRVQAFVGYDAWVDTSGEGPASPQPLTTS